MTLPQQKDLLTGRWRKVRAPRPSEVQIQIALIERLRWQCRPDIIYFHVPNGEVRDKRTAAKLKAMGVKPGVADLLFLWWAAVADTHYACVEVLFLELKAHGRKQSLAQKDFQTDVCTIGCHYEVADSIDAAVAILQRYYILPPKGGAYGIASS